MLNPEEYGKQSSVYMARKERLESEKDIAQLLNRINLLRKEEERNAKRIEETTKKTDEV
jgi:flagellar motility protein MotE (MotC chaperone)